MFGVASYVLNTASNLVYGPTPKPTSSTSHLSSSSSSGLKKTKTKKSSNRSSTNPSHHRNHSTLNSNSEDHFRRSSSNQSQSKTTNSATATSNRSSSTSNLNHHSFSKIRLNNETGPGYDLVDQINFDQDLYFVLGFHQYNLYNRYQIKFEDIRKAYITRSRLCHPDKLPLYKPCTAAFQKLSFAYETLSKPSSRRLYDLNGHTSFNQSSERYKAYRDNHSNSNQTNSGDETLNSVLHSTFCEFMDGDFEMIRVLINALNEGNPGLNLGEEAINNLETSFKKLRMILLTGQKYIKLIRFELIKLYEIQSNLRNLSYLNVLGRVRLSLALARVTLSIPMRIDQVMREKDEDEEEEEEEEIVVDDGIDNENEDQQRKRRRQKNRKSGILPRGVTGLLEATVAVLECGERATMWGSSSSASYEEEPNLSEDFKSTFNPDDDLNSNIRPTSPLKRDESNQSTQSNQSFRNENLNPNDTTKTTNEEESRSKSKLKENQKEKVKGKVKKTEVKPLRRSKSINDQV